MPSIHQLSYSIIAMKRLLAFTLVCALNAGVRAQSNNAFPVQTVTQKGIIEGDYNTHTGIQTYLGVPFAKPPVGGLRWKAPQPMDPWKGVKQTKKFGPRPMQTLVFGDMASRSDGVSEDCLYLNIWTPATRTSKNLPVLLYFFGGGYVAGDGSEPRYDGEAMAKKGIVAITCNYRLNIFGFLAHPELSAEAPYKASGNYGLMDQLAALQWVQQNIAAFGGDPKKVTIAGESAGSISVSYQMASPLARNLIAGAIGESGAGISPTLPPVPLKEAEATGADFVKKAGFKSIAEMRALSTRDVYEIYNESKRFGFPVVADGYFLPKSLPEIFAAGQQAQVPLLLGWNSAEIPGVAFMQGQPYKEDNYVARVKAEYPKDFEEVLKLYPHSDDKEIELSATALAADRFISYSTWKWFDLHRNNSSQPVYRYLFSRVRPPLVDNTVSSGLAGGTVKNGEGAPKPPPPVGAPHASEIEYCMGNLGLVKDYAWTADDYKVSNAMLTYFANFIKTGNPNGTGLPEWQAAKAHDPKPPVMVIDVQSKQINAPDDARYEFLDKAYKNK
jgi:para-nitrobenzyl esterase